MNCFQALVRMKGDFDSIIRSYYSFKPKNYVYFSIDFGSVQHNEQLRGNAVTSVAIKNIPLLNCSLLLRYCTLMPTGMGMMTFPGLRCSQHVNNPLWRWRHPYGRVCYPCDRVIKRCWLVRRAGILHLLEVLSSQMLQLPSVSKKNLHTALNGVQTQNPWMTVKCLKQKPQSLTVNDSAKCL
jgi:hypothetical protein